MVDEEHANLQSKVFFVWGSFCGICVLFVWFFIYETKSLSLEEVDELYGTCTKAWESHKFRPALSFQDVDDVAGGRKMSLVDATSAIERKKSVSHVEGGAEKV